MNTNDQQPLSLSTASDEVDEPVAPDMPDTLGALATPPIRDARTGAPSQPSQTGPAPAQIAFLAPSPSAAQLAEYVVYRPGAAVALALLAGPAVCVILAAVAIGVTGALPVWLPLLLLLWLPALALAWAMLKSVHITPDALACGRPLGQWRSIAFDDIERVEQRRLRLVVSAHNSQPLVFSPALLRNGAQLRRSLLLRLPLTALASELRTQAQSLSEGDVSGSLAGDISGVLTVRTRTVWPALAGGLAVALLALGVAALLAMTSSRGLALALALVALACLLGYVSLWSVQEIFVTEKGLIVRYTLLRRERDVFWAQVHRIVYAPGEVALRFHGSQRKTTIVSAGPGLLTAVQARLMRQFISRYCPAEVVPARPRAAR
jgi:hypothetical protein